MASTRTSPGFAPFTAWPDVVAAASAGQRLYYWPPLDVRPVGIRVAKVFRNGKLRIDPLTRSADMFTADPGHLDRFFVREAPP